MKAGPWLCALVLVAGCSSDDRDPDPPFVPDNNSTANNTTNNTTSTNNGTTTTNNGTAGTNGADYGEQMIGLSEDCEGIAGLNGDALLAAMTDTLIVNMADIDPDTMMHVNPRELTITIDWPADPVAICYPEYVEDPATIPPRLGIFGLTIGLSTTDGELAESFEGAAWLSTNQGAVGSPSVAGSIGVADLQGSYTPGDEVLFAEPLLSVFTTLDGALGVRGNIAMSRGDNVALSYGSFTGRQIVIEWPYAP